MQILALAVMSQYYIIHIVIYHSADVMKIVLAGCYNICNQVTCASGRFRISCWGHQPPMQEFSVKMYVKMKEFGPIGGACTGDTS